MSETIPKSRQTPYVPTLSGKDTKTGFLVFETEFWEEPREAVETGRFIVAWDPVDLEAVR